eukprot:scaffold77893_cov40-Cyclotella_meneghiniana.AAC.4
MGANLEHLPPACFPSQGCRAPAPGSALGSISLQVSESSCALAKVCDRPIYSTYLTYDVIHNCTFYEFLCVQQWADITEGFGRKCPPKHDF